MITTEVTRKLGIKYPIIGGTMMWVSYPEFVAAISNAGGLGVLASAIFKTREEFEKAVEKTLSLTDKPFAVNLNLFPTMAPVDNNDYLDIMIKHGVSIVETSGHSAPEDLTGKFKKAGMTWIHKCVGVRYALKVESMGADMVTVVGYENGGATGKLDTGTMVLIPSVVDAVNIPVIGGGGISDARGLLAVLALGAGAVIMGTRLLLTKESPVHENLKKALLSATELDTMLIMRSVNSTHRVWSNSAAEKCRELEQQNATIEQLFPIVTGKKSKEMYDTGNLDTGIVSVGQGVGLVHDIPAVEDLFNRIMHQAEAIANGLSGS